MKEEEKPQKWWQWRPYPNKEMHFEHEPLRVPDYKVYDNWRTLPELVQHENRLKQMGLKDPWIRNYAWRFSGKSLQGLRLVRETFLGGFGVGVVYCVVGIILTEWYYSYRRKKIPDEKLHYAVPTVKNPNPQAGHHHH